VKRSGAWPRRPHLGPLTDSRGSHIIGLSLSGGEVHHQDPLCLEYGLVPQRCVRLNHGKDLLAGELASPWCCLLLGSGLPSMGLLLLPPMMRVVSSEREASIWPRCHHPRGNRCRGLSGRSVIHQWCGCHGRERSPRATPSGGGEARAPLPT
jgi:hypothetical protein